RAIEIVAAHSISTSELLDRVGHRLVVRPAPHPQRSLVAVIAVPRSRFRSLTPRCLRRTGFSYAKIVIHPANRGILCAVPPSAHSFIRGREAVTPCVAFCTRVPRYGSVTDRYRRVRLC